MKNNDDIPTTDATEIKQLINHVKQGKLDQGDAPWFARSAIFTFPRNQAERKFLRPRAICSG
jgi:hypothetical protein